MSHRLTSVRGVKVPVCNAGYHKEVHKCTRLLSTLLYIKYSFQHILYRGTCVYYVYKDSCKCALEYHKEEPA